MSFFSTIRRFFGATPARHRLDGPSRPIRARYDAAQSDGMNAAHWAAADGLDADSANSLAVRRRLSYRSRYEAGNNGYAKGMVLTAANYVIGRGPKLRMQTRSKGFNDMVEAAWDRWASRVKLARKLRTAIKAKTTDGEAFLMARNNPSLADPVKIDLTGIECEQVTTPYLGPNAKNQVDGIEFDEFGNPLYYDVLPYHPGSTWGTWSVNARDPVRVPARFMFHLFREDRPGQHRAVPETTATLNLSAQGRRWREATVVAAEQIANISVLLKTSQAPDTGAEIAEPFSEMPMSKGMMIGLPATYDAFQPKAEQPTATYDQFNRAQVCEQGRPLNMPYNIAAADSSGYSFSGGKLDHLTFFVGVDTDEQDVEDLVLDPLFELWFAEAVVAYGWAVDATVSPPHEWAWPTRPSIDETKTASARQTDLSTGVKSLRRIYAEDGCDFDDELQVMADDYGVTIDEMRRLLLEKNIKGQVQPQAPEAPPEPPPAKPTNGHPRTNGRFAGMMQ